MPKVLNKRCNSLSATTKLNKSRKGAISRDKGYKVEQIVKAYLIEHDLKEVCSNYSFKGGEIDLILKDKKNLIFVEIRYRKNSLFGSGIESVSRAKQKRIALAANHFLQKNPWSNKYYCRFDVIGAQPALPGENNCYNGLHLSWIKDAFQE